MHHTCTSKCESVSQITPQLFLGSLIGVNDETKLIKNNITYVLSLGCSPDHKFESIKDSLMFEILDLESEIIIELFSECLNWLNEKIKAKDGNILVHCVYGQSRSATIVIALLMQMNKKSFDEMYKLVETYRPCISINKGFKNQLRLFQDMEFNHDMAASSNAHSQFRMLVAQRKYNNGGLEELKGYLFALPTVAFSSKSRIVTCKNCKNTLFNTESVILSHVRGVESSTCTSLFIEPLAWMIEALEEHPHEGKLYCFNCKVKIGSFNWKGSSCSCKEGIKPAFQIVKSKIDIKKK